MIIKSNIVNDKKVSKIWKLFILHVVFLPLTLLLYLLGCGRIPNIMLCRFLPSR